MNVKQMPQDLTMSPPVGSLRLKVLLFAGTLMGLLVQASLSRLFRDPFFSLRLPWCVALCIVLTVSSDACTTSVRVGVLREGARLRSIRHHLMALCLYSICLLASFWPMLPRPFWPGKHFAAGDYQISFYVSKSVALREFAQGRLPLWNPYVCLGVPSHAEMTQATFYPPSFCLMAFLKDGRIHYRAYFWFVMGHLVLASWGTYLLARSWRLTFFPSWMAGLCFGFGGFFAVHTGQPNMVFVASWLPFLLMAYEKMVFRDSFLWALVAGLGQGFTSLGSYLQINVIYSLFILAYVLYLAPLYLEKRRGCRITSVMRLSILCAVGFGLAILVAAVQLLPTQELSSLSALTMRKDYSFSTSYGARPYHQLFFVLPEIFRDSVAAHDEGWWESYATIGVIPVLLIALSFSAILKTTRGMFLCLATLMALFLSMSGRSVWHDILFAFLPVYGQFEAAGRWGLVSSFCLSLAGALALQNLTTRGKLPSLQNSGLAAGLLLLCLLIASRITPQSSSLDLWVSVSFFVMATWAMVFTQASPTMKQSVLVLLAATELLSAHNWRFPWGTTVDAVYEVQPRVKGFKGLIDGFERVSVRMNVTDSRWFPNSGSLYRIPSLEGYVNLPIADFKRMLNWATQPGHEDLLDLLGVRTLVKESVAKPTEEGGGGLEITRREHPFPRAWLVWRVVGAKDAGEEWKTIEQSELNLKEEAVVALPQDRNVALPWNEDVGLGECQITSYLPMEMSLAVVTDRPCLLVVSDLYYPGWKAWRDGQPTEILRTDTCLRGILLAPGRHRVTLQYRPLTFQLGAAITTLFGVSGLMVLCVWTWCRTRADVNIQ